jgi:competence protein ComGC
MSGAMRRLRALFRGDGGFTLIEMAMTVLLTSITIISVTAVVTGLLDDVSRQASIAQVEGDTRPVLEGLVVELRQAKALDDLPSSRAIEELDWDRLVFYSDRVLPHPDPERYVYELTNCSDGTSGGVCDLQETIYQPEDASTPFSQRIVLTGVIADPDLASGPLFSGVEWTGDPVVRTTVSSCDSGIPAQRCNATLIVIDLRVQYPSSLGFEPYPLHEEVRLRNEPK